MTAEGQASLEQWTAWGTAFRAAVEEAKLPRVPIEMRRSILAPLPLRQQLVQLQSAQGRKFADGPRLLALQDASTLQPRCTCSMLNMNS